MPLVTRRSIGAFALGALGVGGFAPFHLFPLVPIVLGVLLVLIEGTVRRRDAFRLGFAFGLGHFLAGVSWVYVSLHEFGAMPAFAAAATTLLFCAYLALFPALAALAAAACRSAVARRLLVFPAAWILLEWTRGWLFTGFPWLALGYSQAPPSPLAGLAPVAGVYGVGLATLFAAGLGVHAFANRWRRPDYRPLLALVLLGSVGAGLRSVEWTVPQGDPVQVSLLQGNVAQSMKWRPDQILASLQLYESMVRASGESRLVVLPETAVPMFLQNVPREFLDGIAEHARARGADVLLGLPELASGGGYFNSVVSVGTSPSQTYRKSHLVPFGEFIPLRPLLAPIVNALAIPLTDFSRGSIDQRPIQVAGQRVAVNICYEDAFGEEIIRQLPEATLLVNVSNVAWFGDSIAPMQHLQIAQMRALETGRYMLRATNTGMTAVVDPSGAVAAAAPTFETRVLQAEVQGYTGATPFVRFGNVPAVAASVLALLAVLGMTVARRPQGRP
jgi:apolipoprotein N-acyltransferase